jgi:hypothetical protein
LRPCHHTSNRQRRQGHRIPADRLAQRREAYLAGRRIEHSRKQRLLELQCLPSFDAGLLPEDLYKTEAAGELQRRS